MENKTEFIKIQDIQKFYPYKDGKLFHKRGEERKFVKAVDGVSLTIERGEILGVIGVRQVHPGAHPGPPGGPHQRRRVPGRRLH